MTSGNSTPGRPRWRRIRNEPCVRLGAPCSSMSVPLVWIPVFQTSLSRSHPTANLRTKILDLRGFDSSIILILRCGILMSIGNFLEVLSQEILVGIILVGRLGVEARVCFSSPSLRHAPHPPSGLVLHAGRARTKQLYNITYYDII